MARRPSTITGIGIVRAMDTGVLSPKAVQASFRKHALCSFSFSHWLAEMVDEGIYPKTALQDVA